MPGLVDGVATKAGPLHLLEVLAQLVASVVDDAQITVWQPIVLEILKGLSFGGQEDLLIVAVHTTKIVAADPLLERELVASSLEHPVFPLLELVCQDQSLFLSSDSPNIATSGIDQSHDIAVSGIVRGFLSSLVEHSYIVYRSTQQKQFIATLVLGNKSEGFQFGGWNPRRFFSLESKDIRFSRVSFCRSWVLLGTIYNMISVRRKKGNLLYLHLDVLSIN